jgi:uncharacterized OsmC-like protein
MSGAYHQAREHAARNPKFTVRAVARIVKDLHMVGRVGRFSLESDEPEAHGGTALAPTPLHYFLIGAAF